MLENVKISHGLARRASWLISDLGFVLQKALFVTDETIWRNCRNFFPQKFDNFLLLKKPKADEKNLKKISVALKNCDLIVGLGSGTINDLCKFTSSQKNVPYVIFASASSMNGYLSKNASITISGHKKTLPATLPLKVFCDLEILSQAPIELTKAGIGDSLCFYSCWFDWYLSHKILGTKFDKKPFTILQPKMEFFVKNYKKFVLRDEKFLKILIEILLLSGQGMTRAGGSYPASQSEHMIAHSIEMKYPKKSAKILHGQIIAVTSLMSARLQEKILKGPVANQLSEKSEPLIYKDSSSLKMVRNGDLRQNLKGVCEAGPRHEDGVTLCEQQILNLSPRLHDGVQLKKLETFFGKKIAAECKKEYEQKLKNLTSAKKMNTAFQEEIKKIHCDEKKLKAIFSHFKIKISAKSLGLSGKEYQDCIAYAKFTRNRFTCLDYFY